ncbi:hypothetical protein D2E26_0691 [Bifidobacterium dolichotidis]|uniref:Uncharacterized protein n=1 Tax=Bifidobacterium dolichotidis TaxID=2306976 RepID=A0A430FTH2_9BIFI|nr:hypothetical protein [Bifidobacterium dolichotidis]RSX56128.1 hypothetical protein D2E26_0691 [Bifidobacterium dolichotidis]
MSGTSGTTRSEDQSAAPTKQFIQRHNTELEEAFQEAERTVESGKTRFANAEEMLNSLAI